MAAAKAASVSKVEDSSSSESDRRLITLLVALPCSLLAAMMLSSVELLFEITIPRPKVHSLPGIPAFVFLAGTAKSPMIVLARV